MGELEDLKKQLASLNAKKNFDKDVSKQKNEIAGLKKQIRNEKFGQSKTGKVFNAIGNFGAPVRKYLATPLPQQTGGKKKKKKAKKLSFNPDPLKDLLRNLPQ